MIITIMMMDHSNAIQTGAHAVTATVIGLESGIFPPMNKFQGKAVPEHFIETEGVMEQST